MSVAYALVVASIAGVPLAFGPGTAGAANHAASGPTYAVGQGGACVAEVQPLGDRSLTGPEHYDYGPSFSSTGTIDLQEPFRSQFYVYDGRDGTNLVFLHSKVTNNTGATGGAVTFDVNGLPTDGEWTVEDDDYAALGYDPGNQSDSFVHEGAHSLLKWRYSHNRTDGAVFRGLGSDGWTEITIDPAFGEQALDPGEDWIHADEGPDDWVVRSGDGTLTSLDMDEPASIREGACDSVPPEARLAAPAEATTEADVTLNATNPDSPTSPVTYEWDFDGDGNFSDATDAPSVDHRYETTGTVSPTVRVTDRFGNTDSATATITVVNDTPPTAVAEVPATVPTGENFTVDASGSSDETGVASYAWEFGDGGSASGVTANHTYDAMGSYTVTLTVTDDAGKTATDVGNVTATDGTPPDASLEVAPNATAGSLVTLDASGSSDDVGIDRFEWAFGDGESATTDTAAVNHEYASAGTYAPTVRVVDARGNAGTANTTITISSPAAGDGSTGNETGDDTTAENDTAPSATFVANETAVAAGEPIAFDATGSTDEDGDLVGWDWAFGDGEGGAGETVVHEFDAGDYMVTLTVYDDAGGTDTATRNVTATAANESDSEFRGSDGGGDQGGDSSGGSNGDEDGEDSSGSSGDGSGGGGSAGSGGSGGGGGGSAGGAPTNDDAGEPAYAVAALSADRSSVVAGETVTVNATVRNEGDGAGAGTVALVVGSTTVDRATVDLVPGERTELVFAISLDVPGVKTIRVGDREVTVSVRSPAPATAVTSMRLEETTIDVGETTTVVATVTNSGEAPGRHDVTINVFGEVLDRSVVSVGPGETRTVRFTQRFDAPGDYTVAVGDREATVHVVGESTDAGGTFTVSVPDGSDRTTALGFVAAGGLALAGVAVLLSRRL